MVASVPFNFKRKKQIWLPCLSGASSPVLRSCRWCLSPATLGLIASNMNLHSRWCSGDHIVPGSKLGLLHTEQVLSLLCYLLPTQTSILRTGNQFTRHGTPLSHSPEPRLHHPCQGPEPLPRWKVSPFGTLTPFSPLPHWGTGEFLRSQLSPSPVHLIPNLPSNHFRRSRFS